MMRLLLWVRGSWVWIRGCGGCGVGFDDWFVEVGVNHGGEPGAANCSEV